VTHYTRHVLAHRVSQFLRSALCQRFAQRNSYLLNLNAIANAKRIHPCLISVVQDTSQSHCPSTTCMVEQLKQILTDMIDLIVLQSVEKRQCQRTFRLMFSNP
jgi:hypothetical protein